MKSTKITRTTPLGGPTGPRAGKWGGGRDSSKKPRVS